MKSIAQLKDGIFTASSCPKCQKIVWPPNALCDICFNDTIPKEIKKFGKLCEFSKTESTYFGLAQFQDIKIMGSIQSDIPLQINQCVELIKCQLKDDQYIFEMKTC